MLPSSVMIPFSNETKFPLPMGSFADSVAGAGFSAAGLSAADEESDAKRHAAELSAATTANRDANERLVEIEKDMGAGLTRNGLSVERGRDAVGRSPQKPSAGARYQRIPRLTRNYGFLSPI